MRRAAFLACRTPFEAALSSVRAPPPRCRFWADLVSAKFQPREPSIEPGDGKQPLVLRRAGSRQAIREVRRHFTAPALLWTNGLQGNASPRRDGERHFAEAI